MSFRKLFRNLGNNCRKVGNFLIKTNIAFFKSGTKNTVKKDTTDTSRITTHPAESDLFNRRDLDMKLTGTWKTYARINAITNGINHCPMK
jgi:hypothetical protein